MKKCCVVFIAYKETLTGYEENSFKQCIRIFKGKRDIKVLVPDGMPTNFYDKFNVEYVKVRPEWLKSISSYNIMCCSKEFYELFIDYEYILIYQTDCWAFEDRLDEFINLGYDWYGAPWPFNNNSVGNGGLSLRKIKSVINVVSKHKYDGKINEDWWFSINHKTELKICPWEVAVNFSLELVSPTLLSAIKTHPMGFHGKKLIDLWDDNGDKFMEFKKKNI